METEKIGRIKKAADITAKGLRLLEIFAVIAICFIVFSGIASIAVKGQPVNVIRVSNFVIGNVSDKNSTIGKILDIRTPGLAAALDCFITAALAGLVLAILVILRKIFLDVKNSDTPYRPEILRRIKITGILVTVFGVLCAPMIGFLGMLLAWCIYCIFDYGIELQKNEDETL